MREIPGYYFDTERNRYFKITDRPVTTTFVTATPASNSTSTDRTRPDPPTTLSYDRDTLMRLRRGREVARRTGEYRQFLRRSGEVTVRGLGLGGRLARDGSQFGTLVGARGHLPPNWGGPRYTVRSIGGHLGEKLKLTAKFQVGIGGGDTGVTSTPSYSEVSGYQLLIGSTRGLLKVFDLSSPVTSNPTGPTTPPLLTGYRERYTDTVNGHIRAVKLISPDCWSYITLGEGTEPGKVHVILPDPQPTPTGPVHRRSFPCPGTSLFALDGDETTLVAGGERSIWSLTNWRPAPTTNRKMKRYTAPSDILSVKLDPVERSTVHAGCRNGTILTYDLRNRTAGLHHSHRPTPTSHAIYKLLTYSEYYLVGAGLSGLVFQVDRRFPRGVVQTFPGLSNAYDTRLGFTLSPTLSTLFAAGDDSTIRAWSLPSPRGLPLPLPPSYPTPIYHLHASNPDPLLPHRPHQLFLGDDQEWEGWAV